MKQALNLQATMALSQITVLSKQNCSLSMKVCYIGQILREKHFLRNVAFA